MQFLKKKSKLDIAILFLSSIHLYLVPQAEAISLTLYEQALPCLFSRSWFGIHCVPPGPRHDAFAPNLVRLFLCHAYSAGTWHSGEGSLYRKKINLPIDTDWFPLFLFYSSSSSWKLWWHPSLTCFLQCCVKQVDGKVYFFFSALYASSLSSSWSLRSEYRTKYKMNK